MNGQFFWLDYSQKEIWGQWLAKLPYEKKDVYFDPDYARLCAGDSDITSCYIYVKRDNVYIYPFIMRPISQITGYFDIFTPYGFGGPVFNTEDPDFLKEAYQCFYGEALKRNIIAEVVKFHPLLWNHKPLTNIFKGDIKNMCSTVYADMNVDEDHRWKNIYTHANRKNINKAKRSNIKIKFGQDDESWQAFKSLYNVTMSVNKAEGFYFFPPEYFKSIQEHLTSNYVLVSCAINGKIISVMLVLLGTVYAHCHLIGTDRKFMNTGVNNLLHHELILWCKNKGYKKLHIGGGRSDSDDDLLLRFKRNFSDKTSNLYVGECVLNSEVYNKLCTQWSIKNSGRQFTNRLLEYRI